MDRRICSWIGTGVLLSILLVLIGTHLPPGTPNNTRLCPKVSCPPALKQELHSLAPEPAYKAHSCSPIGNEPAPWLVELRNSSDECVVSYIDDGLYFSFLEPVLRNAFFPRHVTFATSHPNPCVVVTGSYGHGHRAFQKGGIVKKVLAVGEANYDKASNAQFDVVFADVPDAGTIYVPQWVMSFGERRLNLPTDMLLRRSSTDKTKFCAFMYSHPSAARDAIYDALSVYKTVDSLGKSKNSNPAAGSGRQTYSSAVTYNDLAVREYVPYKFVICGESYAVKGYVTEKILNAFLAGAIPIYVGAPDISQHFNPESFIDANQPGWLDRVKLIDQNNAEYEAMLSQPILPNNQLPPCWFSAEALADQISLVNKVT